MTNISEFHIKLFIILFVIALLGLVFGGKK